MASYLIPITADGGFAPAAAVGAPTVEYATESDVTTAINNLVDTAPAALNTLNELAAALGDDANYAATVTTALGNKADTSSLATVATSGSYADLSNKPTIPVDVSDLTDTGNLLISTTTTNISWSSVDSGNVSFYADQNTSQITISQVSSSSTGTSLDLYNALAAGTFVLGTSGTLVEVGDNTIGFVLTSGFTYDANAGGGGGGWIANATATSGTPTATMGSSAAFVTGGISYNDLTNKPTIPTNTNQLTNGAGFLVASDITGKQSTLVSGTSIKTVNSTSLLGSGNVAVQATLVSGTNIKTINGTSLLGSGNITISGGSSGGTDYSILSEIAIGAGAANAFSPSAPQGSNGIAIGSYAGADAQGANSVSIGAGAGGLIQGANSIALGENAANNYQGNNSIAIGTNAGRISQGNYAIAIGTNAGYSNQPASSICINASQFDMQPSVAGLYIKPVRSATTSNVIYYDSDTGEMTYGAAPSGSSGGGGGSGGEDATAFSWNASIVGPLYSTDLPWTPPAKTGPMIAILAGEPWSTIWTASSNGTTQKSPRGGSSISPPWASAWYGTVSGPQNATTQNSQGGGYGIYSAYSLDSSTNPATDEMWVGQIMVNIDASTGVVSISNVYSSINWSPTSPGYLYGYITVSASSNELAGFTGEAGVTWLLDADYGRIRVIVPPSVWAANGGMGGPIGTITGLTPSTYYNASLMALIFGV